MNTLNYYQYWGKSRRGEGQSYDVHLLVYHSFDVSAVGNFLMSRYLVKRIDFLRLDALEIELIKNLFLFFLALHDIGKFSITFQNLQPELLKQLQGVTSAKPYNIRHDQLGWIAYEHLLREIIISKFEHTIDKDKTEKILDVFAHIAFGHHGKPPLMKNDTMRFNFNDNDRSCLNAFCNDCFNLFFQNVDNLQKVFSRDKAELKILIKTLKKISWELAGIMVIADWIASGDDFSHRSEKIVVTDYQQIAEKQAAIAVQKAGVIPSLPASHAGLSQVFPSFAATPTPLQKYCDEITIENKPQLWILEDVTGSGKTEASLILASRFITNGLADGVFIALPTMATSNAMYERMGGVYYRLFEPNQTPSLVLSHGARHLSDTFCHSYREHIVAEGEDNEIFDENINEGNVHCTRWLADSSKKALLTDTGVGTIDQVLLAVLPVKYQSLRYYGMSRKVLIIDEVHSYDAYMLRILETVLQGHASAGGSVILLSATLPFVIRERLVSAYKNGLEEESGVVVLGEKGYPLATGIIKDSSPIEKVLNTRNEVERTVQVKLIEHVDRAIDIITDAIKKEKCVCWIRNTVNDVFDAYELVKGIDEISIEDIMIFHSRFVLYDRIQIEKKIIKHFGKNSAYEDRKGKILLATQVVEQSLDLDFDLIISDLAPIDLVIQRAGRLHRHLRDEKGNRISSTDTLTRSEPIFYLFIPPETDNPEKTWYRAAFQGASSVYKDVALLWRTKEILKQEKAIIMPQQARLLIESVYGEQAISAPDVLRSSEEKAWGEQLAKQDLADYNTLKLSKGYSTEASQRWDDEERVPTRLADAQQIVYVYKVEDGTIQPLYSGAHAWDMSSLKVRKPFDCEEPDKALARQLQQIKKKYRLPQDAVFLRYGEDTQMVNGKKIIYKTKFGLKIKKEVK